MKKFLSLIAIVCLMLSAGCGAEQYEGLSSTELALIGHWVATGVEMDNGGTNSVADMGVNEQWIFLSDKTFNGYITDADTGKAVQVQTGTWSADYVKLYIDTGASSYSYSIKGTGDSFWIYAGGTNGGWVEYDR
ncbi:MAG: hypothetical protein WCN95_09025 [bacterium]